MTVAISKAVEDGARGGDLRLDRQHQRVRGGLRRAGRRGVRGPGPAGQDRDGQAVPGGGARRADPPGGRQLRRLPDPGPRPRRRLPGGAGQQREPGPDRGAEDGRLRGRGRARRRPGHPLPAGRQRRQHHRLLARATPSTRPTGPAGRRPRMWGFQAAGAAPIVLGAPVAAAADHRHGHPDRQPRLVGTGPGGPGRVRRRHRLRHRRPDPGGLPAAGRAGGRLRGTGVRGRRGRPAPGARARAARPGTDRGVHRHGARAEGPGLGVVRGRRSRRRSRWTPRPRPRSSTWPVDARGHLPPRTGAGTGPRDQRQPRAGLRCLRAGAGAVRRRRRAGHRLRVAGGRRR